MSEATAITETPTMDVEPTPESGGGNDVTVPDQLLVRLESSSDTNNTAAADDTMQGSTPTTTTNSTGRMSGTPHSGRGRNQNDRGSGRIPMGGRGLVMGGSVARPGRLQQQQGRGYYGRGYNQPQRMPMQVHASSGVPFGHVPAYLPGSSSLVEELDQRILLVLRDGKHIIGTLISFDQFGNLVLSNAIDRQIVTVLDKGNGMRRNYYADLPLDGLYIARGESLVLVGEVHDESNNVLMQSVTLEELGNLSSYALPSLEWDFDTDLTA